MKLKVKHQSNRKTRNIIRRNLLIIFLLYIFTFMTFNQTETQANNIEIEQIVSKEQNINLIAKEEDFQKIYDIVKSNSDTEVISNFNRIKQETSEILNTQLSEYKVDAGGRMLDVSREVKNKIEKLGFMYKIDKIKLQDNSILNEEKAMTLENIKKYKNKAIEELQNVCAFKDWHPEHYLDTVEMGYSVALGYNWFYEELTEEQKQTIEKALIEKALVTSCEKQNARKFVEVEYNWNQVCNSALGVIAISMLNTNYQVDTRKIDDSYIENKIKRSIKITSRELSAAIIARTIENLPKNIKEMSADGEYLEGVTYWEYGNTYMVYFLSSLQETLNSDYGILEEKGLKETVLYPVYITGKSSTNKTESQVFNYGDSESKIPSIDASIYLANQYVKKNANNTSLAYIINWFQNKYVEQMSIYSLLWYNQKYQNENLTDNELTKLGLQKSKLFKGNSMVTLKRDFNSTDGIFFAMKGGDNQQFHGDLDIGSFVLDALGTRWVEDFGKEDYNVEGYWNTKNSRWNYYKKRAESHSTLVINDMNKILIGENLKDQNIKAKSEVTRFETNNQNTIVVLDMSEAYNQDKNKVKRGIKMFDNGNQILIQDEIQVEGSSEIYWFLNIASNTQIELIEGNKIAILKQNVKNENGKIEEEFMKIETANNTFSIMPKISINKVLNFMGNNLDFRNNIQSEKENKLVIKLTNVKEKTISVLFTPIYEQSDYLKRISGIQKIEEWK